MLEKSQGAVKPWEIAKWTLPEIFLFLEKSEDHATSEPEARAAAKLWAGLTASEKLKAYKW